MGKVFISYSHDSPEHSERVLALSDRLRALGVDAEVDRYHMRPRQGWPRWCEEQLRPEISSFVLVICTPTYRARVDDRVAADEGRGVCWEGAILYNYIYSDKGNSRFIPVLLGDAPEAAIPLPLQGHARYRIGAFELTDRDFEALYRELTGQPETPKPGLGPPVKFDASGARGATKPPSTEKSVTDFTSIGRSRDEAPGVLSAIDGQLRRESNPRFGFSFVHPSLWDRQDPTNGDGNTYRHPKDPRIVLAAWGQYAVVSPDLHSWVEWTIAYLRSKSGFCLLARVPAGGHLVDWQDERRKEQIAIYEQVEGFRIVYKTDEDAQSFTTTQTFLQYGDTQFGLVCTAPSALYGRYEDLFLSISKELRILGPNSAPFARARDVGRGKSAQS